MYRTLQGCFCIFSILQSHTGKNDRDSHQPRKLQSRSQTFPRIVINSTPVSGDQESPQVVKRRGQSLSEFDVNELYVEPHKSQFTATGKSRSNDSSNTHTKPSPSGGLNGCRSSHVRTTPSSTSKGSPELHSDVTTPSSGWSRSHRPPPAATPGNNKESPLYRRWSGSKKDVKPRGQTSKGNSSSPRNRSLSTSRMKTSASFSVSSELSLRHYTAAKGWDDTKVRETAGEPVKVRHPSKKTSLHVLDRLAKLTQRSPSECRESLYIVHSQYKPLVCCGTLI